MTDNYEYERSMHPQSEGEYSPYTDKQYNSYINDINSGVYTNNGLSLVQFDLSSIYNSSRFTDCNDLFVVLPIVMVAACSTSTAGTLATGSPVAGNVNLLSLKNNFIHLIHQADLTINGKTVEDVQPYLNISKHFQMLSEMGGGDLDTIGYSIGMTETDNWKSKIYNGSTSATVTNKSGNGMTNNRPFVPTASFSGGAQNNNTLTTSQFDKCVNTSIQHRLGRYTDTTAGNVNGLFGATAATIANITQLKNDFTPTYEVLETNYMVWYDYAVIKLSTVFESLQSIGLTRKADIFLRLYINTGTINVAVSSPNTTAPGYSLTTANNSFTGTCPFTVNYLTEASASGGIVNTTAFITAGLYLAKPPATSFNGINLGNSKASHPLPACRIYYSQITIQPALAEEYVMSNRGKKCIYRTVLTNQYNNITAGGNFNQLISSGIVHPTGILIVPYVSSTASFSFGDFATKSPFDTVPADGHPLSLTNLQVSVGGQNVLQSVLNYNYESFIEQLMYAEQLTSADFGVSTGLFDAAWWNYNRFYWVNVERSNITDKLTARNLNISFTNNNNVPIDVLVFTFKSNGLTIDVETGIVSIP
jgi:hypothetical protein